jgi:hypothetical protein
MSDDRAEDRVAEAQRDIARGEKLAVDVLRDLMRLSLGLCAYYQPRPAGSQPNPNYDESRFRYYAEFAATCAKLVAGFESPKLAAVAQLSQTVEFEGRVKVTATSLDLERMTDAELLAHYRARVAGGPVEPGALPVPAASSSPIPDAISDSVPAPVEIERAEAPLSCAPIEPEPQPEAVQPVEDEPGGTEPDADPPRKLAPTDNVVEYPSEPPKPSVAEQARRMPAEALRGAPINSPRPTPLNSGDS